MDREHERASDAAPRLPSTTAIATSGVASSTKPSPCSSSVKKRYHASQHNIRPSRPRGPCLRLSRMPCETARPADARAPIRTGARRRAAARAPCRASPAGTASRPDAGHRSPRRERLMPVSAFDHLDAMGPIGIWDGVLARTVDGDNCSIGIVELDPDSHRARAQPSQRAARPRRPRVGEIPRRGRGTRARAGRHVEHPAERPARSARQGPTARS